MVVGLWHLTVLLGDDDLDVGWARQVWVDSTVSSVSSSSLFRGLVDLDVLDDERLDIESLDVGVRLCISEESEDEDGGLDWPSGLVGTERFSLSSSANTSLESSERDSLLVLLDILKVLDRLGELHSGDGLGCLPGVLEVCSQVITSGFGGLLCVGRLGGVTSHF